MDININNINDLKEFCQKFVPVSYETEIALKKYADLLVKWQEKINLVSPSTIGQLWLRHMADSAQLMRFVRPKERILDVGSGAGFPGVVLAIFGCDVTCVESDQRKCAFMINVARETGITLEVQNKRIEDLKEDKKFDWVSARALASVSELLDYAEPHMGMNTKAIFLKGKDLDTELTSAKTMWHIKADIHASLTDPTGSILIVEEAKRV